MVKAVIGLRPSLENEAAGLDLTEHGEEGYHGAEGWSDFNWALNLGLRPL